MSEKQFVIICRKGMEVLKISTHGRGEKKKKKIFLKERGYSIISIIRIRPWTVF